MGLDITAYGHLYRIDRTPQNYPTIDKLVELGSLWRPGAALEWAEKTWPGRTAGFTADSTLMVDRVYGSSETFRFRAGSYSGYGHFRDWLARLAGWESAKACWDDPRQAGPFFELVNFADNEGVIGAKTASKLAEDFHEYERKALAESDIEPWYHRSYTNWHIACDIAAQNGAIDFH